MTGVPSGMSPLFQEVQYGALWPRVLAMRSIVPSRLMSSQASMPQPSAVLSQARMESPGMEPDGSAFHWA